MNQSAIQQGLVAYPKTSDAVKIKVEYPASRILHGPFPMQDTGEWSAYEKQADLNRFRYSHTPVEKGVAIGDARLVMQNCRSKIRAAKFEIQKKPTAAAMFNSHFHRANTLIGSNVKQW